MIEHDTQDIICNKCHNAICRESLVTCLICKKTVKKNCTLKLDTNKYSSLENDIQEIAKSQKTNSYICKNCDVELQQNMTCVCCNRHMQTHLCKMYNKLNYDFTNFVVFVLQCLQHVSHALHDDQYICSSCDKTLKETSDENPFVPHYARYANVVTGANFLKALHQRPEYVCTCCHHRLFCKTVQQFHIKDYDISNETIKASLSH